ncbi:RodZ domain-containing protein [Aliiglaciecola sp. SL4]|uniref:RodZ domain-containing protein n=1 Tax=Aliiglaciecola sp. SL4 TaxID=3239806 RepID=UPI00355BFFCC
MTVEQQEQPVNVKGPGAILKEARDKLGLKSLDIANKLHLKVNIIESIESDEYDPKISMTFIKGYLKLYAKQVNVDEQVIVEAFASQTEIEKEPAKLQSFSKRVAKQASDDRLMLITYGIIAALLALVVIWWLQQDSTDNTNTETNQLAEPIAEQVATDITTEDNLPDNGLETDLSEEPTADDLIISAQISEEVDNASEQNEINEDDSVVAELAQQTDVEIATDEPQNPANQIELVFEFSDNCWMNLKDATGEAIAYGVKKQGRVMTVSGVAPFEVTLGAPSVVQIRYDGVLVDMSRFEAGKSAKFSLPFAS